MGAILAVFEAPTYRDDNKDARKSVADLVSKVRVCCVVLIHSYRSSARRRRSFWAKCRRSWRASTACSRVATRIA